MTDPAGRIRILIVDDHAVVRMGIRMLIESQPTLLVAAEAATSSHARTIVSREQVDVILLDLDLGEDNGLDLLPDLLEANPSARVLQSGSAEVHRELTPEGLRRLAESEGHAELLDWIERWLVSLEERSAACDVSWYSPSFRCLE